MSNNNKDLATGLGIGLGVGLIVGGVLGLLFAPKSGLEREGVEIVVEFLAMTVEAIKDGLHAMVALRPDGIGKDILVILDIGSDCLGQCSKMA